ncbi:MAG: O-succinylhomoserine sulfhydrylase [Rhodobacterales bacterium]|nr:MAG: O-succinylhomoserine sulfhydrylase [Rhodobacterales bacterium]
MDKDWNQRTKAVHCGIKRSQFNEVAEAIYLTQGYVYDSAETAEARFLKSGKDEFIYARYGNPTTRMFEERMAALDGCEDAFACASGMAAVNGAAWDQAITPDTKLVFVESIANPTLELVDIAAVAKLSQQAGALLVVDNVFATPVFSNAFDLGADVVIYSSTKHIDGQGRCLGGVILGSRAFIRETVEPFMKHTGGALSPFNAWVMLKGLETLDLRCRAMADSALKIAQALDEHPKLSKTTYPHLPSHPQYELAKRQMSGGSNLLALEFAGGKTAAFRFLNALELFTITNNLGDCKSLITHPATTTHQSLPEQTRADLGITPGLVRLSIGIEHADDLLKDINNALAAV